MAEFMVNTQGLSSKMEQLSALNQRLKSKKSELEQKAAAMRSMWEGDAQVAFTNAVNTDVAKITEFENAIQEYCTRLGEIITGYQNAEAKSAEIARNRTY